jgi:hypothetical protein
MGSRLQAGRSTIVCACLVALRVCLVAGLFALDLQGMASARTVRDRFQYPPDSYPPTLVSVEQGWVDLHSMLVNHCLLNGLV